MLREDGMVVDDGTVWRLAEQRWLMTSSTGGGDRMVGHLSYVRKILDPGLKAAVASVQERWGAIALAGPRAKAVLAALGAEALAHMGLAHAEIDGLAVLVLAASYSGERAFELYAPSHDLPRLWAILDAAVRAEGGAPYGLEALELLRIERATSRPGRRSTVAARRATLAFPSAPRAASSAPRPWPARPCTRMTGKSWWAWPRSTARSPRAPCS